MSNIRDLAGRILFFVFLSTLATPWFGPSADAASGKSLVPPSNFEDPDEDSPDPDPFVDPDLFEDPDEDSPDPDPLVSEIVPLFVIETSRVRLHLVGEAHAILVDASGVMLTSVERGERQTVVLPQGRYEVRVEAWGRYRLRHQILPVGER